MIAGTEFPLARYRFEWRAVAPVALPDYAGSMLRGAFGHALRQLACMTKQKECGGCPILGNCPYPAIFAPPPPAGHGLQKFSQIPVPYVIEAPDWGARVIDAGATFSFHVVLIGRALAELPLVILAWRRALARGVGPREGTANLLRVLHCGEGGETVIHEPESGMINAHPQLIPMRRQGGPCLQATLRFDTPLRLQNNGHALSPEKLGARALLMALVRRASLLSEFHAAGPLVGDFSALVSACARVREEKDLRWRDWTRYSSRQAQKMVLGGVVGEWRLEGDLEPFAPFLHIGQWLHVGKEAAFGLGKYRLLAAAR